MAEEAAKPEQATPVPDDENIPYPTLELYRHTIMRGANLGSVLSLIIAPPYLLLKGVRCPREFMKRTGSITAKGMVKTSIWVAYLAPINVSGWGLILIGNLGHLSDINLLFSSITFLPRVFDIR